MLATDKKNIKMRSTLLIFMILALSCNKPIQRIDIRGTWKIATVDTALLENKENTFLYSAFYDAKKENIQLYIDNKNIEFPLGFRRLGSMNFNDNFVEYTQRNNNLYSFCEQQNCKISITMTKDSLLCFVSNNQPVICFQSIISNNLKTNIDSIIISSTDEFMTYNAYITPEKLRTNFYFENNEALNYKSIEINKNDYIYLMKLSSRLLHVSLDTNYNKHASDVPLFNIEVFFSNSKYIKTQSNGYSSAPAIPFELHALIVNLDKLVRRTIQGNR